MNLRWLWFDHIPHGVDLTPQERAELKRTSRHLQSAHPSTSHKHGSLITAVIGWSILESLVLLVAIFYFMPMMRSGTMQAVGIVGLLLVICVPFWIMIALAFNRSHATFVRQALNDMGHPVCMKCGYVLKGLGDLVHRCPECGEQRVKMPVNQPESTR